jgi:hypothetical protein
MQRTGRPHGSALLHRIVRPSPIPGRRCRTGPGTAPFAARDRDPATSRRSGKEPTPWRGWQGRPGGHASEHPAGPGDPNGGWRCTVPRGWPPPATARLAGAQVARGVEVAVAFCCRGSRVRPAAANDRPRRCVRRTTRCLRGFRLPLSSADSRLRRLGARRHGSANEAGSTVHRRDQRGHSWECRVGRLCVGGLGGQRTDPRFTLTLRIEYGRIRLLSGVERAPPIG